MSGTRRLLHRLSSWVDSIRKKHVLPQVDATVKELKGIAVCPGTVTGKARVILHADDHEHVEPGEILVAPSTDPAWTPYLLPAAGVVMDMGGVLCMARSSPASTASPPSSTSAPPPDSSKPAN